MIASPYPSTHRFVYELDVEISSTLSISSGELGVLICDGLVALDNRGVLFPGVALPAGQERLVRVTIGAVGYTTIDRCAPVGLAYRALLDREVGDDDPNQTLFELVERAQGLLGSSTLKQRMLMGKLLALADRCRHGHAFSNDEKAAAARLVRAALKIEREADAALTPVL